MWMRKTTLCGPTNGEGPDPCFRVTLGDGVAAFKPAAFLLSCELSKTLSLELSGTYPLCTASQIGFRKSCSTSAEAVHICIVVVK